MTKPNEIPGRTASMLWRVRYFKKRNPERKVLIVCPTAQVCQEVYNKAHKMGIRTLSKNEVTIFAPGTIHRMRGMDRDQIFWDHTIQEQCRKSVVDYFFDELHIMEAKNKQRKSNER